MMRYFRPTSLAWWAGVFLIAMGVLQAAGWPTAWGEDADGLTGVLNALAAALTAMLTSTHGAASPATLIGLGAGVIGLRDKLERDREEARWLHDQAMLELTSPDFRMDDTPPPVPRDLPPGESPLPPGVIDPWEDGGSRS